jgi:flagellar hook assembly protein FlgD
LRIGPLPAGVQTIEIYQSDGRRVRQFFALNNQRPDWYWDGTDIRGRRLNAGIYYLVLKGINGTLSKKIILFNSP